MDSINQIKLNLEKAKAQRLFHESTEPKTRHTIYLGDRTIQQLGQSPIENGVVLNNQSIKIGDPMLPLAKGNVLRRVDNTNGGALLGSAYRDAVENDFDINGDRRNRELSRNGGNEPSNPSSPSTNLNYPVYPPPFGCVPPPQQCFWSTNPIAPDGFQGYGDVVLNENALPLYLYCQNGIQPPDDLGCTFLAKNKWGCSGGICSPDPNGLYNSQTECEAALIPPSFTGGQCVGISYKYEFSGVLDDGTPWYCINDNARSTPYTDAEIRAASTQVPINGSIVGWSFTTQNVGFGIQYRLFINNIFTNLGFVDITSFPSNDVVPSSVKLNRVVRVDAQPDNCGDPAPSCPI